MIIIALRAFLLCLFFPLFAFGRELLLLAPFDESLIRKKTQEYLWSEKLDGVRAYWDGKALYTRKGKLLNPPKFFTQNFPPFALDGELWSKRGDFENIVSITQIKNNPSAWQQIKFYIFEVPNQKGGLLQRLEVLQSFLDMHPAPYLAIIPQNTFSDLQELQNKLDLVIELGGEGLVLRNKNTPYYTGRTKDSMKLKKYQDRECKIIAYHFGKGKLKDKIASFSCQDEEKILKIGSGIDESFRKTHPPLGTIITYKYYGLSKKGNPKYPTFLRVRQ